jgi:hypothetical protein
VGDPRQLRVHRSVPAPARGAPAGGLPAGGNGVGARRREESSLGREGKDQGMEWRGVGGDGGLCWERQRRDVTASQTTRLAALSVGWLVALLSLTRWSAATLASCASSRETASPSPSPSRFSTSPPPRLGPAAAELRRTAGWSCGGRVEERISGTTLFAIFPGIV